MKLRSMILGSLAAAALLGTAATAQIMSSPPTTGNTAMPQHTRPGDTPAGSPTTGNDTMSVTRGTTPASSSMSSSTVVQPMPMHRHMMRHHRWHRHHMMHHHHHMMHHHHMAATMNSGDHSMGEQKAMDTGSKQKMPVGAGTNGPTDGSVTQNPGTGH